MYGIFGVQDASDVLLGLLFLGKMKLFKLLLS